MATRNSRFGAMPDRNELTVNSTVHTRKKRRRPKRADSHPVAGIATALAARYEVTTQDISSMPADIEPCMCGKATLVTLVSSTCMTVTIITDSVTAHRRPAEIVCASAMWYKAFMRRLIGALSVVLVVLVLAPSASAEWFLDGYLGPAVTPGDTLTFKVFNQQFKQDLSGRSSPSFGLRFGRWLEDFNLPWLGIAADVSYFRPANDVQTVPISLLAMARYGFLKDEEFPRGRLQPYAGLGFGVFISNASGNIGTLAVDDTSTDVGFDARLGVAYQVDPHWALFTEYRFTHVSPSWKVNVFGTDVSADTTFDTHHVVLGVSCRF
jgi:opacity protein-like surface antigen